MNKGTSAAAFGATLFAGILFQARNTPTPGSADQRILPSQTPSLTAVAKAVTGAGPWSASCHYWAAAQTPDTSKREAIPSNAALEANTVQSSSDKDMCGPASWNIPIYGIHPIEITTIVATVPDPIHSHLALDFDRSIDAILLAAADNHYSSSYYWLPWRSQISISSTGESTSTATRPTEEDRARERQPGLIILRYAPDAAEWDRRGADGFEWTNYRRVIYLFLVGETPSLGVNGNQLQNAFAYEKQLQKDFHSTFSIPYWSPSQPSALQNPQTTATENPPLAAALVPGRAADGSTNQQSEPTATANSQNPPGEDPCAKFTSAQKVSILGPFYSGSASSLHAGTEAAFPDSSQFCVSLSGVTATVIATRELDPDGKHVYRSFGENTAFEQERFLQSLAATGYDLSRVAVLSEAGTIFGSNANKPTTTSLGYRSTDVNLDTKGTILYLRFPRELSLLRNTEASQTAKPDPSAPPTPYLNLSLKDYATDDTVPRFSTNQSPLSIEAQLMSLAHQLQHERSQFLLISASNVLDDIFLAQFLHRACPDARLVILSGGDLLFERDVDNQPYIGSISLSPYLLSSLNFGEHVQWFHASYQAEAIYNAASFTFWNGSASGPPTLAGYRNYPVPTKDNPAPPVQFQQIPLWATVIGTDGYYPLAVLNW